MIPNNFNRVNIIKTTILKIGLLTVKHPVVNPVLASENKYDIDSIKKTLFLHSPFLSDSCIDRTNM